jgi:uncharacterized protein YjdB
MAWQANGKPLGNNNDANRIEALEFEYNGPGMLMARAYVQNVGWMSWIKMKGICGTTGQHQAMEAIEFRLCGAPELRMTACAHVSGKGWLAPVTFGEVIGSVGESRKMTGLTISIELMDTVQVSETVKRVSEQILRCRAHIIDFGWLDWIENGEILGKIGEQRRIEAIEFQYSGPGKLMARAHSGDKWRKWKGADVLCGSVGKGRALTAVELKLEDGEAVMRARPYICGRGWLRDVGFGKIVGWPGNSLQMEALQIMIDVPKTE